MNINKEFDLTSIIRKLSKHSNGLALLEVPTGTGKTYSAAKYISDYIEAVPASREHKKVIFLTHQKKNYPDKEIISNIGIDSWQENGMILYSMFDIALKVFDDKKISNIIPKKFKNSDLDDVFEAVQNYKSILSQSGIGENVYSEIIKEKRHKIEEKFSDYKRFVKITLKENKIIDDTKLYDKDKNVNYEYVKNILKQENMQWLKKVFPNVMIFEKSVIIANLDLFMVNIDTVIAGSIILCESLYKGNKLFNNSLVFMDEFDSSREIIEKRIRSEFLNKKINARYFLMRINAGFEQKLSKKLQESLRLIESKEKNKIRRCPSYDELKIMGLSLQNDFKLNYHYKLDESQTDDESSFIFNDIFSFTINSNSKKHCSGFFSEELNRVTIEFHDRNDKRENGYPVISVLSKIRNFIEKFILLIRHWSEKYMELENKHLLMNYPHKNKITLENAIATILNHFNFNLDEIEFVSYNYHNLNMDFVDDCSYYQRGYSVFELIDNNNNNEETLFNYTKKNITPEKIIIAIARHAMIIGLSATANIEYLYNYNLVYIKDVLGDLWHEIDIEDKINIQNYVDFLHKEYERNNIRVVTKCLDTSLLCGDFSLSNILKYLNNKDIGGNFKDLIAIMLRGDCIKGIEKKNVDFVIKRYLYCFEIISLFLKTKEANAWLVLNKKKASKEATSNFSQEYLLRCFRHTKKGILDTRIKQDDDSNVVFLTSTGIQYEKDVAKLKERLSNGEKLLIFTAYRTIMTGQNFNYLLSNISSDDVKINMSDDCNDARYTKKDIDGIFLGDITYATPEALVNGINCYEDDSVHQLIDIFEILREKDLISYPQERSALKAILSRRYNRTLMPLLNQAETMSDFIDNTVLYYVWQSIGRLTRGYVKNRNIFIFITSSNLYKLSKKEIMEHYITPEMKGIMDMIPECDYSSEGEMIRFKASRISSWGKKHINDFLNRNWNSPSGWLENDAKIWTCERENSLKYPTATQNELNNLVMQKMCLASYITAGDIRNSYNFFRVSDFNYIDIDFEMNKAKFLSQKEYRSIVEDNPDIANGEIYFQTVSEQAARLDILMKFSGMKEFFIKNGYATTWEKKEYIMSPVYFNNIYKGALGEACGKFILEKLGIIVQSISDPRCFELFDFVYNGIYIDFKHWKNTFYVKADTAYNKIEEKMLSVATNKVVVINIIGDDTGVNECANGKIFTVNGLINDDGELNLRTCKELLEVLKC